MRKILLLFLCSIAFAQQPQTKLSGPQAIQGINSKWNQGVGTGYWPTKGSALTLNLTAGTSFCSGAVVTYAGGTLTMTNTTNYIYLDTGSSCVPAVKTSAFTSSDIPLAVVVASGSVITSITDDRTMFFNGATPAVQYTKLHCESGLGDGLNAMVAATYLQTFCYNNSGVTWTITSIKCFTDNSGTSTLNATDSSSTALLTGAVTCSSSFAGGTQSGTTTIASGGYIKFTFVADGTSKQTTWIVSFTQ